MEKKKFLAMLLACLMFLTTLSPAVLAADACEHKNLGPKEEMKAATCTKNGISKQVCQDCGEALYEAILAHHTEPATGVTITKQPTCVDEGEKSFACAKCGNTVTETVPATGEHKYEFDIKDETCTENAKVGSICEVCGKEDPSDPPAEVPGSALGHDEIKNIVSPASCVTTGEAVVNCSRCDYTTKEAIAPKGHKAGPETAIDPTCVSNAAVVTTCESCGIVMSFTDLGSTNPDFQATGHKWDLTNYTSDQNGEHSVNCEKCDAVSEEACEFVEDKVVDATCHTYKTTTYVCQKCDYSKEVTSGAFDNTKHDYEEETVRPATCTKNGIARLSCKGCTEPAVYAVIPASHKITGEVTPIKEAVCEVSGSGTALCSTCNQTVTVEIPALKHNIVTGASVASGASCEESAKVVEKCSLCGKVFRETGETISGGKHTFELVIKDATCTDDAVVSEICTVCGTVNDDPGPQQVSGSALGHDFTTTISSASCGVAGEKIETCKVCGTVKKTNIPAKEHEPEPESTTEPATCEHQGREVTYCTICGKPIDDLTVNLYDKYIKDNEDAAGSGIEVWTPEEIAAVKQLEHKYVTSEAVSKNDGTHTVKCELCQGEKTENCSAYTITVALEATCNTYKTTITTCEACGYATTVTEGAFDATNHDWITKPVRQASCSQKGISREECKYCGAVKENSYAIIEVAHTWDPALTTTVSQPACGVPGAEQVECGICHTKQINEIPAVDHVVIWVTQEAATCTHAGVEAKMCSNCGSSLNETRPIAQLAHEYEETMSDETCTEPIKIGMICKNCGASKPGETIEVPDSALGHDWVTISQSAVTCTEDGVKYMQCQREGCNAATTEALKAPGHQYPANATNKEPDCLNNAREVKTCSVCGYEDPNSLKDIYQDMINNGLGEEDAADFKALGHDWGDVVSNGDATHTRACQREDCDVTETTSCKADPSTVTVAAATCQTYKTTTSTCASCAAVNVVTEGALDSTNHDWKESTVKAATCTKNGVGKWVCACGTEDAPEGGLYYVIKANHTFDEANVTVLTPASCTVSGVSAKPCSVCGVTLEIETAPLGHEIVTKESVAATCTMAGVEIDYCTRCEQQIGEERAMPVIEHVYEENYIEETCTEDLRVGQMCKYCGTDKKDADGNSLVFTLSGSALGHDWKLVSEQAATCSQAGVKYMQCDRAECDATTTEAVKALNHTPAADTNEIPADCDNNALEVKYCTVCGEYAEEPIDLYEAYIAAGDEETAAEYKALGHQWSYASDEKGNHTAICEREGCDGTIEKEACNYDAGTPVQATCQVKPGTKYVCEDCGYSYVEETADGDYDQTQHNLVTGEAVRKATCTKNGVGKIVCKDCGNVDRYYVIDAAGAHDWGTVNVITPSSCSVAGSGTRECSICHIVENVEIEKLAHKFGEDYANEEGNAILRKCADCGTIEVAWSMPGFEMCKDGNHAEEFQIDVEATAPTCEESGRTAGVICSNCGESISGAETILALGHDWDDGDIDVDDTGNLIYLYTCLRAGCGATRTEAME